MAFPQFTPIRHIPLIQVEPHAPAATQGGGASFGDLLQNAVEKVQAGQEQSRAAIEGFLKGDSTDLHTVVLEAQRAELAFDFALEVRNKAVQAYQEIMRMQI